MSEENESAEKRMTNGEDTDRTFRQKYNGGSNFQNDCYPYGEFVPALEDVPGVLAFYRRGAQENVLVLTNFGTKETEVSLDKEPDHILLSNQGRTGKIGRKAVLRPCEALVLKMK